MQRVDSDEYEVLISNDNSELPHHLSFQKSFLNENLIAANVKEVVDKCFDSFFCFPKFLLEMFMLLSSVEKDL